MALTVSLIQAACEAVYEHGLSQLYSSQPSHDFTALAEVCSSSTSRLPRLPFFMKIFILDGWLASWQAVYYSDSVSLSRP